MGTWLLIELLFGRRVISYKWVFDITGDGTENLSGYRATLFANTLLKVTALISRMCSPLTRDIESLDHGSIACCVWLNKPYG